MSNIQSGINQLLSQIAILGRLSPGFEQRQEAYKLGKEKKILSKEEDQNIKSIDKEGIDEEKFEQVKKHNARGIDLAERQLKNNPTKRNYRKLMKYKKVAPEIEDDYAEQLAAQQAGQAKAAKQLQQKMSFDDFKKKLPVKDLPQNLQERAYNEYTSKE